MTDAPKVGDVRADSLTEFITEQWPDLVRFAIVVAGQPDDADDIVRAVLVRVATRWPLIRNREDHTVAVYVAIVRTQLTRWRRQQVSLTAAPAPAVSSYDGADPVVKGRSVLGALRHLTPRQRAALAMRFMAGLDEFTTAKALHCKTQTIAEDIAAALVALRRRFPDLVEPELFAGVNPR